MRRSDFRYELPPELIAREPLAQRRASRMLFVDRDTGERRDDEFRHLPNYLRSGDIVVLNNTRVIPARLYGHKETGGKIEVLVERVEDDRRILAQLRASKPPSPGARLTIDPEISVEIEERRDEFYRLRFLDPRPVIEILEQVGNVPLPPYIDRPADASDRMRYQTVYAQHPGAVAAPTAGLHFDEEMLATLEERGVETVFVTLHVGAGTFQPVRTERLEDHRMHSEYLEVTAETCARIDAARARGGRVWAVGTTVVRSLETAAGEGVLRPYCGYTRLFIVPGFEFRVTDGLLTNFHLPESTLLMLVCAFAGYENTLAAYHYAVEHGYRFFSYGDAMLIA